MGYKDYPDHFQHVVMFSGGGGSWAAARRVADHYGNKNLHLLFADTKIEDEDLYRFLEQAKDNIGGKFHLIQEGRDPWQVFFDSRFLGNSRIDPCSRILKRDLMRKYIDKHFNPSTSVMHLGIDWSEMHRFDRAKPHWLPWTVEAPLCEAPYRTKPEVLSQMQDAGISPPRLYAMGFTHNNCGGFCVKAGQGHFKTLLKAMPDRYAYHEGREREFREFIGKDVSILVKTVKGIKYPYTLEQLRKDIEEQKEIDELDIGGCGCFSPNPAEEE